MQSPWPHYIQILITTLYTILEYNFKTHYFTFENWKKWMATKIKELSGPNELQNEMKINELNC